MTYEEALVRLLEIAGDYNEIYNTHVLNKAIAQKDYEQIHKEVKKLVEDLSPSPSFLSITLESCGYPIISSSYETVTVYNSIYSIQETGKEEEVRGYIERLLLIFLRNYIRSDRTTLEELIRANSYVSLIYRSLTPELLETFTSSIQKLRDRREEQEKDTRDFLDYRDGVRAAMKDTIACWLKEDRILPGTKLSIINLKTRVREIRTVKRVSYSDGIRVLTFEECSSIVRGDDRIEGVESWLLNNPEYTGLLNLYY